MRSTVVLLALVVATLCCCLIEVSAAPVFYYSSSVYYSNGAFRTYFSDDGGIPNTIGVEFSGAFFIDIPPVPLNIPTTTTTKTKTPTGTAPHHITAGKMSIPLPEAATLYTPFQSFYLEYSGGHPYPYNVSHFDLYFFFQDEQSRLNNITAGSGKKICGNGVSPDTWCRGIAPFAKACCPPAYGNIGLVLPEIGGSLNDFLATERLAPSDPKWTPFQSSFGFTTFNGRLTGYRNMVSFSTFINLLNGGPKVCVAVRLPTEMASVGYYPRMSCVYMTAAGNLRLEYSSFKLFNVAGCKDRSELACTYAPRAGSPPPEPQCVC